MATLFMWAFLFGTPYGWVIMGFLIWILIDKD